MKAPIYIHPNTPPADMVSPFLERGLDGAIYGFAVECGMHVLTIITSGVFDRFPNLRLVVGHLGEALPPSGAEKTAFFQSNAEAVFGL